VRTGVDYATDNITVYRFCKYNCRYCWAWRVQLFRTRIERGRYDPVQEARKYLRRRDKVIVVSFTSDPYPVVEMYKKLTRRVLLTLSSNPRNRVLILTKNPLIAVRDIDVMLKHGDMWLGTTIITLNDEIASFWEPKAPPPSARLEALRYAKSKGVKTWISIEPIIPNVTYPLDIVEETVDFIDFYVLGALNYAKLLKISLSEGALKSWYRDYVIPTISTLRGYSKDFFIKKELKRYVPTS